MAANRSPHYSPNISVLQVNLNHSQPASLQLSQLAVQNGWDVLLLQEPYTFNSEVAHFSGAQRCFAPQQHLPTRAAIVIINPDLSVHFHHNLSTRDMAVAEVSSQSESIIFISAYHHGKPRHNRSTDHIPIDKLAAVFSSFPGRKICVGVDSNAYADEWGSGETDNRGRRLTALLASEDCLILNDGLLPTYCHQTTLATSFIDVTAVSASLSPLCHDWSVSPMVTMSDHRYISFKIRLQSPPINHRIHSKKFCVSRANWEVFDAGLMAFQPAFRRSIESCANIEDIERTTELYMDTISVIAKAAIPLSRVCGRSKEWWTPELTILRTEKNRLWNRLHHRPHNFIERHAEYLAAYRHYRTTLRKTRDEAFEDWCTVDEDLPFGPVYDLFKAKRHRNAPLKPLLRPDGSFSTSEAETIDILLTKYFPIDDITSDTPADTIIREVTTTPLLTPQDDPFSVSEVRAVIWSMKTKRTPGYDLITAPILRQITEKLLPELTLLFNKCLLFGCFPGPYKRAIIKFIPKPNSEGVVTAKAFRPICLLTTIGKALDSLLIKRIQWFLGTNRRMSDLQFGFTPQKGTIDALLHATDIIGRYRKKQWAVYAISLDIESAFDSAKWHHILSALRAKDCPSNLYRLAQHYFSDRWVTAATQSRSVDRQATQGCMQGSPSGPVFWNILYDGLLTLPYPPHVYPQAYADDALLIVCGSRPDLAATLATRCLSMVADWGAALSLRFNPAKTQILNLGKGADSIKPIVLMAGTPVSFSNEIKLLGVTLDKKLTYDKHIAEVCHKTRIVAQRLARVSRDEWGFGPRAMKTLWRCALKPAITYASALWARRAKIDYNQKILKTTQRLTLLRAARAYRTVSHEALYTLNGVIPIMLRIEELATHHYVSRRTRPLEHHYSPAFMANFDELSLTPKVPFFSLRHPSVRESVPNPNDSTVSAAKQQIRTAVIAAWQQQWATAETGRHTFLFFPSIEARLAADFVPGLIMTQFLTQHGDFKFYLRRFELRTENECPHCSLPDTVQHRLTFCPLYAAPRATFVTSLGDSFQGPPEVLSDFSPIILNGDLRPKFLVFAKEIMRLAKEADISGADSQRVLVLEVDDSVAPQPDLPSD